MAQAIPRLPAPKAATQMTPEEKTLLEVVWAGLMINIVWLIGLVFAILKILK
jgi:hypothetical protein